MSLFLGNLSPRTRREELERVFRRYGRSNIQLKDGYGFVIYEFPANAERALKALRGKYICGEQISITWANKQPRAFQRFSRTTTFHKPYHGRNSREEANNFRNRDSHDRRSFIVRQPFNDHRGPQLADADAFDREAGYTHDEIDVVGEEKHPNSKEGLPDEDDTNERNPVGNDRWGSTVSDSMGGNVAENEVDFERYEPNRGYERTDDDENRRTHTPGSAAQRSSPEKGHRERSPNPQQICFVCGLVGHKMRTCPQGDASRRDRFDRLDRRRHHEMNFRGRGEERLKRTRTTSLVRHHAGRNPSLTRRHAGGRRSHSGKPERLVGNEKLPKSGRFSRKVRTESKGKRRRERATPNDRLKKKRVGRPASSSLHSDSTATSSRSCSPSSRSASSISSRSRSRSVSSRTRSESSSSRSASVSSYSKSASSRSRSILHKSLSLSISLDQKSQSSPKNVHLDASNQTPMKAELDRVSGPGFVNPLVANSEDSELGGELKDDNAASLNVIDDISGEHHGHVELGNVSAIHIGNNEKDSRMVPQERVISEKSFDNHGERTGHCRPQSDTENLKIPVGFQTGNSIGISPQEMCTVLKHYGLAVQEECEPGLSVDAYFGAARMWPWEMIYYRRLKKGPISTENYARRVAQNREFGIVDRYIRSSSGWAECGGTDT